MMFPSPKQAKATPAPKRGCIKYLTDSSETDATEDTEISGVKRFKVIPNICPLMTQYVDKRNIFLTGDRSDLDENAKEPAAPTHARTEAGRLPVDKEEQS